MDVSQQGIGSRNREMRRIRPMNQLTAGIIFTGIVNKLNKIHLLTLKAEPILRKIRRTQPTYRKIKIQTAARGFKMGAWYEKNQTMKLHVFSKCQTLAQISLSFSV